MANIFPRWTVTLPLRLAVFGTVLAGLVILGVTYYVTPKYSRVGYEPVQPIPFDHSLHVNQLGIDCRYCHQSVEVSANSSVPSVQTCMTCHTHIKKESPKLEPLRAAWNNGQGDGPALRWVRIHEVPDYAFFNHAAHVNAGVSCVSCHGNVNHMAAVSQTQPQSMGWCLDCHRHPDVNIRPRDKVTDLDWQPANGEKAKTVGAKIINEKQIAPPQNCGACHR